MVGFCLDTAKSGPNAIIVHEQDWFPSHLVYTAFSSPFFQGLLAVDT